MGLNKDTYSISETNTGVALFLKFKQRQPHGRLTADMSHARVQISAWQ